MIESHVGKDKRGNEYHAMLFREVYTFINEAPETMLSLFEKYINNEDNEDALELIEKYLHILIPEEVKNEFIKYVSAEHDVDWGKDKEWDLVEGAKKNTLKDVLKNIDNKGFLKLVDSKKIQIPWKLVSKYISQLKYMDRIVKNDDDYQDNQKWIDLDMERSDLHHQLADEFFTLNGMPEVLNNDNYYDIYENIKCDLHELCIEQMQSIKSKQYNPKNTFIPREAPYSVDVNKGKAKKYWKSTKNKPVEQTGVEAKIKEDAGWKYDEEMIMDYVNHIGKMVKNKHSKKILQLLEDERSEKHEKCRLMIEKLNKELDTENFENQENINEISIIVDGLFIKYLDVLPDEVFDQLKDIKPYTDANIPDNKLKGNKENKSVLKPGATIDNIHEAMGAASAIFMSNPLPGTKQVMPSEELDEIASKTIETLENKINVLQKQYMNKLQDWTINSQDNKLTIELKDAQEILSDLFNEMRINLYAKKDKRVIIAKAKHFATEHIQPIATEIINVLVEKLNLDNYSLDGRLIEEEIDTILENYLEGYYMFESDWFQKKHR